MGAAQSEPEEPALAAVELHDHGALRREIEANIAYVRVRCYPDLAAARAVRCTLAARACPARAWLTRIAAWRAGRGGAGLQRQLRH
jgi:hypothetical protein